MTRRFVPALVLMLAACVPAALGSDRRHVFALPGGIDEAMYDLVVHAPGPATFLLSKRGGWLQDARRIAQAINMRGDCVQIGRDGILQSSGVVIFRLANCRAMPDPDARVFGIHRAGGAGFSAADNAAGDAWIWAYGYRSPGCREWYARQPEARGNGIAMVSWNDLERGCR